MGTARSIGYGIAFGVTLISSWTLATWLIAVAFWSGPHTNAQLARWASLWFFAVAAPGLQAIRIHRCLQQLLDGAYEVPDPVTRDLMHTRFALPMFGMMTVLAAFSLVVSQRWPQ